MATTTVEGFSISHAAILDGATGAELVNGDVYGVREGSVELDMDSYDNAGDDVILSTWYWFNFATVTVQAGYIPFSLLATLSGTTLSSSGTAPNDYYTVPLWDQVSLNVQTRPMIIRVPSKDSLGAVRNLDLVLFKVQFQPFSFDGPSYKNGLLLNYTGKALVSTTDEKGTVLPSRAVGKLISRP